MKRSRRLRRCRFNLTMTDGNGRKDDDEVVEKDDDKNVIHGVHPNGNRHNDNIFLCYTKTTLVMVFPKSSFSYVLIESLLHSFFAYSLLLSLST